MARSWGRTIEERTFNGRPGNSGGPSVSLRPTVVTALQNRLDANCECPSAPNYGSGSTATGTVDRRTLVWFRVDLTKLRTYSVHDRHVAQSDVAVTVVDHPTDRRGCGWRGSGSPW